VPDRTAHGHRRLSLYAFFRPGATRSRPRLADDRSRPDDFLEIEARLISTAIQKDSGTTRGFTVTDGKWMPILRAARIRRGEPLTLANRCGSKNTCLIFMEEISGFAKPSVIIVRNILETSCATQSAAGQLGQPSIPENCCGAASGSTCTYDQRLTLPDLAAQAGLSVPHFCTEFRRCFGAPPITYLIGRRMRVAAALLRGTAGRIGEIGRQVGYDDPYYFSKHFKAFFGLTPSAL